MTDSDKSPVSPLGARLSLILAAFLAGVFAFVVIVLFVTGRTPGGTASSAVGGPFTLTDQSGGKITDKDFLGKPFLVFFGFTHCPDVCPTTLFEMSEMMRVLGKDADKAAALFVSVDPERDTPPVMKDYMSNFDPHVRGATGDQASIDAMIKAYRVYAKKVSTGNGEYTMDHTALVYLMDKKGNFVAPFNMKRPPEQAAADLRKYF